MAQQQQWSWLHPYCAIDGLFRRLFCPRCDHGLDCGGEGAQEPPREVEMRCCTWPRVCLTSASRPSYWYVLGPIPHCFSLKHVKRFDCCLSPTIAIAVAVARCLIPLVVSDYQPRYLAVNLPVCCILLLAKSPLMHRVRILDINATPGIDDHVNVKKVD